jgi:hypothetical protein
MYTAPSNPLICLAGYSIDILMWGGQRGKPGVAVEVDGPFHFVQGAGGGRPDGSTLLKRRHLKLLGYVTVSVHWSEWRSLRRDARGAYLDQLLKTAMDEVEGSRFQGGEIAGSKAEDKICVQTDN